MMAGNDYVNLFDVTYDAINAIKKKDLVDFIEKMINKSKTYIVKLRIFQRILKVT